MFPGQYWFPGYGWRYPHKAPANIAPTAFCTAPGRWMPIAPSPAPPSPAIGSLEGKHPLSQAEGALLRTLIQYQPPSAVAMPRGILDACFNNRLDLTVMNGWLQSYVYLCSQAGAFTLSSSAQAQALASSALTSALSGLSALGGPITFIMSTLANIGKTIFAALSLGASVQQDKARLDQVQAQIFNRIGPPPVCLDEFLMHSYAIAIAFSRSHQPKLSAGDMGEVYRVARLFDEPPIYLQFGCLMLLAQLRILGTIQPPPLLLDQIQTIANLWTEPGESVQFLDLDYLQNGPLWLRKGTQELVGMAQRRNYYVRGLIEYYKTQKAIGLFHLGIDPIMVLMGALRPADASIYGMDFSPRAITDKARIQTLGQAIGVR